MGIFKSFFGKKHEKSKKQNALRAQKTSISPDLDALKEFCTLILCGHNEKVFNRCKEHIANASDPYGSIPEVLYTLSGHAIDPDDPFGNVSDEEKQLVKPQYYLISSDAGAPCLEDFFWFIEDGIQKARGLNFTIHKEKFSDHDCIVEWLVELSAQLENFYIVQFDGASEDYHFTIMNLSECKKAMDLFKRMTAHIDTYVYTSFLITKN